ncbi:MAG: hypothetical protein IVW57_06065 [Ktedonobacterales bacterium]|nr:hypothetical protein [Ktedonobacterales bacterium]
MITCERCGADAVDARGRCRNCGWQAPADAYTEFTGRGSSPSLGETRAAEVPASVVSPTGRTVSASPRSAGDQQGGMAAGSPRSFGAGLPPVSMSGGPTSRYCGVCGAQLEPGRGFCGQCGTPVSAPIGTGTVSTGAAPISGPPRHQVGGDDQWGDDQWGDDQWSVDDGNAPTEAVAEVPPPFANPYSARTPSRTPLSGPYGGVGYASGAGAPALETPSGSSRTIRIVLGILCLFGSIISAIVAVILALAS